MSLEFMPLASQHEASVQDVLQDFADHGEPTINGDFADRTWPIQPHGGSLRNGAAS